MRLRLLEAATGWRSLLISALLCSSACAKKDAPRVSSTKFDSAAVELYYFDDSDVILQELSDRTIWRSPDAGESWAKVGDIPDGKSWTLVMHPFDHTRAYVLTSELTHYKTTDQGESWMEFYAESRPDGEMPFPMSFNPRDPDRIILDVQDCAKSLIFCDPQAMYTTDNFETEAKLLRTDTAGCSWAVSTDLFTTGQQDLDLNRILCVTKGKYSPWRKDYRLVISDNFFTTNGGDIQEFEPYLEGSRTVAGVINTAAVKKYILVAVQSENTDELSLYVTDDTIKWHRAVFPHDHRLLEEGYTVLESTNYSIQIDVMTTRNLNPMGVLLSSNSNGTYFTRNIEHTNRDVFGIVDFEKIAGIQGIVLVNTVENWEEVRDSIFGDKTIKSQISFDDGRTWQDLIAGKKSLHIHSVTDSHNPGRVLSSLAPGLVMGVGNTGPRLKEYDDGDTYVSDDAGVTWTRALKGPHKYEFGDQGSVLVAVKEGVTDKISYSLNHGKDWDEVDLGKKIQPWILTTTADSTSLKFLLVGTHDDTGAWYVIAIDFNEMQERTCKPDDLEKWYARVDEDGKPTCLMGHKQYYMRRKKDADCFLKQEFKNPEVQSEPCECTDADFECDYNFVRSEDRKSCIQQGPLLVPEGECEAFGNDEGTFMGSSGWRMIPGNECTRNDKPQKDDPVERKCNDALGPPASGKVEHTTNPLHGAEILDRIYLERTDSSTGDDETIVIQTDRGIYLTHDHGKTWKEILEDHSIKYIIPNPYFNDAIFFITEYTDTVYYSMDRGDTIQKFQGEVQGEADKSYAWPMQFHPANKDWIIWTGVVCPTSDKSSCHAVSSISRDRGDDWQTLQRYVEKCEFVWEDGTQKHEKQLVYCKARARESTSDENNPWRLVASKDFFENEVTHFNDIVDYKTMSEYILVAVKDENEELKVDATVDGNIFAEASFPNNFHVPHRRAYTVLDSSTHAIFLQVMTETTPDFEWGTVMKSNSNGTSYVLSLNAVNSNQEGYVDFEKMFKLEGVALANVVSNSESAISDNEKRIKSMITHNDGSEWALMSPPAKDIDGNSFGCSGSLDKCSLHIHSYTERTDKSRVFSSPTAVGLMLGVGNVGEYLGSREEADTFITSDAGITWRQARKGSYMWKFGDQGSLIVLLNDQEPSNVVYYSRDEGDTWNEYKFSEEVVTAWDLSTLPSDNSRNFLIWGKSSDGLITINLDFSGLTDRQCLLEEDVGENDDYYLWSPKHPLQGDDCLFGHVAQYHRKKTSADCYVGKRLTHLHNIAQNCECTRRDFECDYNYQMNTDGSCSLVPGLKPLDHSQVCRENPDLVEYWEPTGYRRIPLSTCEGGKEMEYTSVVHPCPGKEEDFWKKRRISGVALFFAITLPIIAAIGAGYWVYRNWEGKFGQIRLGEQGSAFDERAPYIKYPVMAISAAAALILALPVVASSAWRGITGLVNRMRGYRQARFTTRRSFAREANYAAIDEDEGELLGEDSDEEGAV